MFFINIDNRHWVVMYISDGTIEYFDPTSDKPSTFIKDRLRTRDFVINDYELQRDVTDLNCGLYCILYAYCKLVKCMTMNQLIMFIIKIRLSKGWLNCKHPSAHPIK